MSLSTPPRIFCIEEPRFPYTDGDNVIPRFLESLALVEDLIPEASRELVKYGTFLQTEQKKVSKIFEEIGLYQHCRNRGCCAPHIPAFFLSPDEILVNAALIWDKAREGEKQVHYDNLLIKRCNYSNPQNYACVLPLKPARCLTYHGCIQEEVPALETAILRYQSHHHETMRRVNRIRNDLGNTCSENRSLRQGNLLAREELYFFRGE